LFILNLEVYEIDTKEWSQELLPFYEEFEKEGNLPEGTVEEIKSMR